MEGLEGLNFDSILNDDQVESLFADFDDSEDTEETEEKEKEEKSNNTTEVKPEELFGEEPESVGSGNEDTEEEDTKSTRDGTSPEFFSSIANAFVEEGIFPDLQEDEVKNIKNAQDLRDAIDKQINAGLTEQQQRIIKALNDGVETSVIKRYENVISQLNNIDDDLLEEEGEQAENLRKNLLYQDYINRGFSKQRAEKAVNKAFEDGTDIDDAKDALEGLREFYTSNYQAELEQAEENRRNIEKENKERRENFKNNVLKDNFKMFDGVPLDKVTRQKAFDAVTKPVYKDPSGRYMTALGKYSAEHPEEYMAKLGLLYVLTNGFENLDALVNKKAKKEIKKGFADLENKLNNTRRDSMGNIQFTSGSKDSAAMFGKNMTLNI